MTQVPHRISIDRIEHAASVIDPVFLNSPQFVCEPLGELLGSRVLLKVETLNPIRCFKGRGADFLVSEAKAGEPLLCASAGNFGQAMAFACRRRGLKLTVYAAVQANPLKLERIRRLGADVVLHGEDFDAAKAQARHIARERQIRFVEDGLDIQTVEGAGTMGLELLRFSEQLDCLLLPLGNGAMFNGIARVMKLRSPRTRIIAIQAAGAASMIDSWRAGRIIVHDRMETIADGIGVRIPIAQALEDMRGLVDDAILVSESDILRAMKLLHEHAGVCVEPSGAVGIAAMLARPDMFNHQFAGTILSGGNLTPGQMREWLQGRED